MGGGGGFLGLGGGGGGGGGYTQINYPQPQPIDYDKMAAASIRVAQAQTKAEEEAIKRLYPEYIRMQFGTADQLSGKLDNQYLQRSRGIIGEELQAASAPSAIESELARQAQADLAAGATPIQRQLLSAAEREAAMGQTAIESRLLSDAQNELALGRALSAEEQRDATQSARAAMAARGLATGLGASAAEVLNRDAYGRQRQNERRQFAMGAEQYARAGLTDRRNFAMGAEQYALGQQAARRGFAADANQMDLARRQRRIGLGGMYLETDPYRQALGPAFGLGGDTLRTSQGQVSNIFDNSLTQSGNVASFNTNMQASMYNSAMNNNAAVQAANMQAAASRQAGGLGMLGQIGGGLLSGAGMALAFSDKRMKKDIKPLGKTGSVLGLTAYEFKYKGEDEKHVGFMAQDVKKVLPEAVEEVEYKGKKRLAIKPAVIGAALAEELMTAKAA